MIMENFDINYYDNKIFHEDENINTKIIVLFLKYDFEVIKMKLEYPDTIKLMRVMTQDLIDHEEFEVVRAFVNRRQRTIKFFADKRRQETRPLISFNKAVRRALRMKFKRKIKNLLKK